MANCPHCGSGHLQMIRETNVSWGRAVAGWALFGIVGGAVGAVTGEERNVNACLDCGTTWKATELYKTIKLIKELTGVTLSLGIDNNRIFMNEVIPEITNYLREKTEIKNQFEREKKKIKLKGHKIGWWLGIAFSFISSLSIILFEGKASYAFLFFWLSFYFAGISGSFIGNFIYSRFFKQWIAQKNRKLIADENSKKTQLESKFQNKVKYLKVNILNQKSK